MKGKEDNIMKGLQGIKTNTCWRLTKVDEWRRLVYNFERVKSPSGAFVFPSIFILCGCIYVKQFSPNHFVIFLFYISSII